MFHADCKLKNIAADRIADFDGGVGAGEFSGVARTAEVVEDGVAEHVRKYGNAGRNLQRRVTTEVGSDGVSTGSWPRRFDPLC